MRRIASASWRMTLHAYDTSSLTRNSTFFRASSAAASAAPRALRAAHQASQVAVRGDEPRAARARNRRAAALLASASPTRSSATSNGAHASVRGRGGRRTQGRGVRVGSRAGGDGGSVVARPQIGVWDVRRLRHAAARLRAPTLPRHRRGAARVRELRGEAAHGGPEPVHEEPLARSQVRVREQRAPRGAASRVTPAGPRVPRARGFGATCAFAHGDELGVRPLGANGESAPNTCAPRGNDRALSPRATTSPLTSRPRISGSIGAYSARADPARTRAPAGSPKPRRRAPGIGRESRDGHVLGDAHHLGAAERAGHRRAHRRGGTRPAMTARLVRERGRECGASAGIREKRRRLSALSSSGGILSLACQYELRRGRPHHPPPLPLVAVLLGLLPAVQHVPDPRQIAVVHGRKTAAVSSAAFARAPGSPPAPRALDRPRRLAWPRKPRAVLVPLDAAAAGATAADTAATAAAARGSGGVGGRGRKRWRRKRAAAVVAGAAAAVRQRAPTVSLGECTLLTRPRACRSRSERWRRATAGRAASTCRAQVLGSTLGQNTWKYLVIRRPADTLRVYLESRPQKLSTSAQYRVPPRAKRGCLAGLSQSVVWVSFDARRRT